MEVKVCTICGGASVRLLWPTISNADGMITDQFQLYQCDTCGAGMTHPIPTVEELNDHYQSGIYQRGGGRGFYLIDRILSALSDARLAEIARFRRPPATLLDVGSGKGRFVSRARLHGWAATGLEISSAQAETSRRRYNIPVNVGVVEDNTVESEAYDVVTAWHVLEHASNPHTFITGVARILKPRGLFVCEVPNLGSWQAQLGGPVWFQLDIPRHITHFTADALRTLLAQHHFTILEQHTFSPEVGIYGMLQTLSNRAHLPANLLFRWLKRSSIENSQSPRAILTAALLALPALMLECASASRKRGGILRIVARRSGGFFPDNDHGRS